MDIDATNSGTDKPSRPKASPAPAGDSRKIQQAEASVTIVMSFRERWRFTPFTVESILHNTAGDFDLWLLDSGMPDDVRSALQPHVHSGALKIIEVAKGRQPNDSRGLIIPRLESRYAVFIDNDVAVSPGWLARLVSCAQETGAGIVCPLYLWGDKAESDMIHMAGGDLELIEEPRGIRMTEKHRHLNRKVSDVSDELKRETVDFAEFHCMMMRREVYSAEGVFSPEVVSVHEHIQACLRAKELGYATWIEPEATVNNLAFAPWLTGELSDFRRRWNVPDAERSLQGFAARWGIIDDGEYRHYPLDFVVSHVGRADLLDPRPRLGVRRDRPMTRADLQQTFGGWEWLALESGYTLAEVQLFANAYVAAIEATNGVYRPCGRPFINHLVGTASVLTFYGCPIQLVLAGLLHSIASLGEGQGSPPVQRAMAAIGRLGSTAANAIQLVHLYTEHQRSLPAGEIAGRDIAGLPCHLAATLLMEAANEVDMRLSFEVPVSGRHDVLSEQQASECQQLLDFVGLPGLAETLRLIRKDTPAVATVSFGGAGQGSFRFDGLTIVSAYV